MKSRPWMHHHEKFSCSSALAHVSLGENIKLLQTTTAQELFRMTDNVSEKVALTAKINKSSWWWNLGRSVGSKRFKFNKLKHEKAAAWSKEISDTASSHKPCYPVNKVAFRSAAALNRFSLCVHTYTGAHTQFGIPPMAEAADDNNSSVNSRWAERGRWQRPARSVFDQEAEKRPAGRSEQNNTLM